MLTCVLTSAAWAQQTQVNIENVYSVLGEERYAWTIWIAEPPSILDQLKCVEYTLHPTFPSPVRTQCDASKSFSLSASGWGEFTIKVRLLWKDGHETTQSYQLDLSAEGREVTSDTRLLFPLLEINRVPLNKPEPLRWPGFSHRVVVATEDVDLHSNKLSHFHLYLYVDPSATPSDRPTLKTIKKMGSLTRFVMIPVFFAEGNGPGLSSIIAKPSRTVFSLDNSRYSLEPVAVGKDYTVIFAIHPVP